MRILTTAKPQLGNSRVQPNSTPRNDLTAPAEHHWQFQYGSLEYDTASFLERAPEGETSATLVFKDHEVYEPLSATRKAFYSLKLGTEGAIVGAVTSGAGAMLTAGIAGLFAGHALTVPGSTIGTIVGASTLIGAGVGITKAIFSDNHKIEKSIHGTLKVDGDSKTFHPRGDGEFEVDLNAFQSAAQPAKGDDEFNYGKQWWNSEPQVSVRREDRDTWNPADFFSGGASGGG